MYGDGRGSITREDPSLRNNSGFRFTSNQHERVSNALKQNSVLDTDTSGFEYVLDNELRKRNRSKEIGP